MKKILLTSLLLMLLFSSNSFSYLKHHWHQFLKTKNCPSCDLQEADMSGLELQGVNFGNTNLSKANLSNTDLSEANLYEANLKGANLNKAILKKAYLKKANLTGANLKEADLTEADLKGVKFCKTTMPDGKIRSDHCDQPTVGLPGISKHHKNFLNKIKKIEMLVGESNDITYDFAPAREEAIVVGDYSILTYTHIPSKRFITIKGLKSGKTSLFIRDAKGNIKKRFQVTIK